MTFAMMKSIRRGITQFAGSKLPLSLMSISAAGLLGACALPKEAAESSASTTQAATSPAAAKSLATAPATQPAATHWTQEARLRDIMAELLKQNPDWPAGAPKEPESPAAANHPFQFDEMATVAHALATAAGGIDGAGKALRLSEADRAGFVAESRTLREQAAALQAAANLRDISKMKIQIQSIQATCISCHNRYRDVAGPIKSPQA